MFYKLANILGFLSLARYKIEGMNLSIFRDINFFKIYLSDSAV